MISNRATYYYGEEHYTTEILLLRSKLSIEIGNAGEKRTVFWDYYQIKEEGLNHFTYPGVPKQSLRITSNETAQQLSQKLRRDSKPFRSFKAAAFLKVLLFIIATLILFYIFAVPWLAGKMANSFPINYEKKLGDQLYNSMKGSFTIDEKRTASINEFFQQLKIPSKYEIKITVVKSDVINAFAMPGGHIVVYDKLLNGLQSYEQLAALLAHEFTHIENRHTLRNLFRQFSSRIFLSLLFGNTDAVSSVLVNNANNLKSLSYSRSLETESDENGAKLLAERGIDCKGFADLFLLFKKETGGAEPPEFINSHPNLDKRIENIRELSYCTQRSFTTDSALHTLFLKIQTAESNW